MLEIQVTAHQSLALGVRPVGTAPVPTHLNIPGSVLRGALAAVWIAQYGLPTKVPSDKRREFIALFESDVSYGPLFATGSQVVPLSVLRCKYRTCAAVVDEAFNDAEGAPTCACGPLVPGRGEVEFTKSAARGLVTQSTHLQIDDARGVAEENLLFTRRALTHRDANDAERTFHGRITPGSELPDSAARWLAGARRLRLGARRGTSGAVTYTPRPAVVAPPATGLRIALRLTAPAILTDPSGLLLDLADRQAVRSALDDELAPQLGGARVTAVERVWARRERVGGWHAASRLPKPVELAVSAGSVLLLTFDRPPAPDRLLALTGRGIGLRRNEGFGALETATTAWEQPAEPASTATDQDQAPDPAEAYAWQLFDTGHGPWFVDNLRPYVEELAAHPGARHIGLLERPRLRRLTPNDRETLTTMLLNAPVDVLDRTLGMLNALVRGLAEKESLRP
ncbi:type III-B CRISPR module-associated Cmr3 family protein [Streptomyces sp. NPDC093707]|uniref:type III-B CRISPR module-associated Cmr3 family protein n=1 Tax=Streptomyces sp. NPDC093707 TaxID=3154984 RepID=UPI00344D938A